MPTQNVTVIVPAGGGADDSPEIQAALDALRPTHGVPVLGQAEGGTVRLGPGTFTINTRVKVWSGTWLEGDGPFATLLTGATSTAIVGFQRLPSGNATDFITYCGIRNLRVEQTGTGKGIDIDGGQFQGEIHNVMAGATGGGIAIDLGTAQSQWVSLRRLSATDQSLSNSFLQIGSQQCVIDDCALQGSAHGNWQNGRPLVTIGGGGAATTISNSLFGFEFPEGKNGYAVELSGSAYTWFGNHVEMVGEQTNDRVITLTNAHVLCCDQFGFVENDPENPQKVQLIGASTLESAYCDIAGNHHALGDYYDLGANARFKADRIQAFYDADLLDDPRVHVSWLTRTTGAYTGRVWPRFLSAQNYARPSTRWQTNATNGANISAVASAGKVTVSVEEGALGGGFWWVVPLRYGTGDIAQWKITTPAGQTSEPVVYTQHLTTQLASRAMNSKTFARFPTGLGSPVTELHINMQNIVPGTYTLESVFVNREDR